MFPLQFTLSDGAVRAVQRTVSSFALDRFEVTYSRFREFLAAYDSLDLPREGDGAHPKIARSGWQEAWNRDPALSKDRLELEHDMSLCGDWRDPAAQDLPVRCVNWFIAMRFCIWDGGRLPTEAEWTYAASAGSEAREYPWENAGESESIDEGRAWYTLGLPQRSGPIAVGSRPTGHGRFGQDDLAGNVVEWVADWYHQQVSDTPCIEANNSTARRGTTQDCMELNPTDMRSMKGGSYRSFAADLTTFARAGGYPARNGEDFGFRCVRDPK